MGQSQNGAPAVAPRQGYGPGSGASGVGAAGSPRPQFGGAAPSGYTGFSSPSSTGGYGGGSGYGGGYGGYSQPSAMTYSSFSGPTTRHEVELSACPVRAVTVFPDRARVRRAISVPFTESGKHEIVVTGLASHVDPKSFKVTNCPLHIIETHYAQSSKLRVSESPNVDKQRHELDQLNALRHKFLEAGERLEKELALIEQFAKKYTRTDATATPDAMTRESLEAFDAFLELYHRRLEEHDRKRTELKLKIDDVDRRIHSLMDAMDAQYSETLDVTRTFTIVLGSHSTGQVSLDFSYATSRAWWTPSYDVRISPQQQTMAAPGGVRVPLHFHGIVEQHTGEEWADVALVLSTAKKTSGDIPAMAPNVLRAAAPGPSSPVDLAAGIGASSSPSPHGSGSPAPLASTSASDSAAAPDGSDGAAASSAARRARRRRKRHHKRVASPSGADSSSDGFDSGSGSGTPDVDADTLALRAAMLAAPAAQFNVQTRATIASGARERVLVKPPDALASANIYYCIPKLSPHAFLRVQLSNTTQTAFIAGPANVYFNNAFVTATHLDSFSPGEVTEVFVGSDPEVQVHYALNTHNKTPSSKRVVEKFAAKIAVQSLKIMPVHIRVRDQIPVVSDTRIKLKVEAPTKKDANAVVNATTGLVQWNLSLAQGAPHALSLAYTLEYPLGLQLA
ncbi:uncharacterized protein AMSG_00083 [Thecamonas trahens ATCC 50062]|uniref:Mucoidy inhibitor A n=1 Tax=Thecamonas trahens ATCC 50062 TaxID=461836 RepID=A0A0L0D3T8_THETB|nr:hypothetical protein AMSG_00083 [Thecamonas trahens ATCC 50062]KNC45968.1 hypothetical protein AMSG_00083 [Thecamonas trahens ATCC 50062]|eukprot:XP_013762949.1 hypothetical protein AMSG_00083 [Thecamonas trahens ATCC 50062]